MTQYTAQSVYDYLALGKAGDFVDFKFEENGGNARITRLTNHFCTMPTCEVEISNGTKFVEHRPSVLLPLIELLMAL